MKYFIFGSSGGLGSYLTKNLATSTNQTVGIDIRQGEHTSLIIDSSDLISVQTYIDDIVKNENSSICFIMSIAQSSRIRGGEKYLLYANSIREFLSESELFIRICHSLNEYSSQSFRHYIIVIGSVLSDKISLTESPLYSSSKACLLQLAKYAAIDLMSKVSINTISPALMARSLESQEFLDKHLSSIDPNLEVTPYSDIIKTIKFLTLEGVNSLKGKNIILDYGLEDLEVFWATKESIS